jgi:hypothetical protein
MKPSLNHQYRVKDLLLDNIAVIVLQKFEDYSSREDVNNLAKLNSLYQKMVPDVFQLRSLEFGKPQEPRIGYANQLTATATCSHYRLFDKILNNLLFVD